MVVHTYTQSRTRNETVNCHFNHYSHPPKNSSRFFDKVLGNLAASDPVRGIIPGFPRASSEVRGSEVHSTRISQHVAVLQYSYSYVVYQFKQKACDR